LKNPAPFLVPALLATAVGAACAPAFLDTYWAPLEQSRSASLPHLAGTATTVMVGAGDIAYDGPGAEATARLLDAIPGTVFNLGDNAYQTGSPEEFARHYHPTWGRHLGRTRPTVGNHEYRTPGAEGYFRYFGARAGEPGKGYYAYDVSPDWRVVVINSAIGGSDNASPNLGPATAQYRWLADDLDRHATQNVIAMWHHPTFSSGIHGDNENTNPIWQLLHQKGADIALWGHDHHYERFYPMDGAGKRNDGTGIQSFVVGTGGKNHYKFIKFAKKTTAVRDADTFGVLKLTLAKDRYEWEFIPEAGKKFTDKGSNPVH
jgi:hypothetical protein